MPSTPISDCTCSPDRMVQPRSINMDGIFGVLNNVVWTSRGPCAVANFEHTRMRLRADGQVMCSASTSSRVWSTTSFPTASESLTRTGSAGSPPGSGTTVMHEGFVNFNAGTLGASMVEGRISAGVVVGDGSDIGGGASIMGTLSGGGTEIISIGERCLVGANAGVGISLGDDCIVEAGLYLTAGTKVRLPDESVVRARDLSSNPTCATGETRSPELSRRCRGAGRGLAGTRRCTPVTAGPDVPRRSPHRRGPHACARGAPPCPTAPSNASHLTHHVHQYCRSPRR